MEKNESDLLISAWIALQKAGEESEEYNSNFWATEEMWELSQNNPELCLNIILEILRRDNADKVLENLAAGPLEDLLRYHGPELIDRIEMQARKDEHFRMLLGGVWQNEIADEVWKRVRAVAGEGW